MSDKENDNENIRDREDQDQPFRSLSEEARDLYLDSRIPRISVPSPLVFYRDYVSRNRPVVIQGALEQWSALSKWKDSQYLRDRLGDHVVTIDVTPDGYGDSVKLHKYFVTPVEERMPFDRFMNIIEGKEAFDGVVYCQHQNSSFTTEFPQLNSDIHELAWVREAFGSLELNRSIALPIFTNTSFVWQEILLMLSISGLALQNQFQRFIMIPMKISMVLCVVENILLFIHLQMSIG